MFVAVFTAISRSRAASGVVAEVAVAVVGVGACSAAQKSSSRFIRLSMMTSNCLSSVFWPQDRVIWTTSEYRDASDAAACCTVAP